MHENILLPNTLTSKVHLMYLLFLTNLTHVSIYNWGSIVLAYLYPALDHRINFN